MNRFKYSKLYYWIKGVFEFPYNKSNKCQRIVACAVLPGDEEVLKAAYKKYFLLYARRWLKMNGKSLWNFLSRMEDGNWERLWLTDIEKTYTSFRWQEALHGEMFYCSDRMSPTRLMRMHYLYLQLLDSLKKETPEEEE